MSLIKTKTISLKISNILLIFNEGENIYIVSLCYVSLIIAVKFYITRIKIQKIILMNHTKLYTLFYS